MAKVSSKINQSINAVLEAIDAHKKTSGSLPDTLECNTEVYGYLHAAVMLPIEDDKLKKMVNDRDLKTKVNSLLRVRINPELEIVKTY